MEGFRELIRLHLADQAARDAQKRQEALRVQVASLEGAVAGAREALAAAEERVKALQLQRRAGEIEIEKIEDTRRKYRAQLMSAKTNDIYKTLLSEIETAGQAISARETGVLELMDGIESAGAEVGKAQAALAAAEKVLEAEASKVRADIASLEEERAAAAAQAEGIATSVPPNLLSQYRRIAEARDGRGMALARGFECSACHVAIRPQAWVDLLAKEEPMICGGCRRFLYREESLHGTPPAPPAPEF
jgi:predicted  nucleic acid-binding Zn-ribbon protein